MTKIIIAVLLLSSTRGFSQIEFGVKAGLNISTIDLEISHFDTNTIPFSGFQMGVYSDLKITSKLSFRPELLIQNKAIKIQFKLIKDFLFKKLKIHI